jgi:replication factor C subunit 3/5
MLGSNHHIELNPADCGNKDTFVVQEVIKEIAQFGALDSQNGRGFKVVVLSEVDNLSKNAQAALRRTMEKYTSSCRLILCCERPSKVIDPVRSRCLGIRVAAPKQDQIVAVLQKVCKSERVQLPDELAVRIAAMSKRNLRRAVLMLEACKVQQYPMAPNQVVNVADWERFIGSIANDICRFMAWWWWWWWSSWSVVLVGFLRLNHFLFFLFFSGTQQSPKSLLSVRSKLYELLTNCIPADLIIKELTRHIMRKCDDQLKIKIAKWSAFYEHRLHLGKRFSLS